MPKPLDPREIAVASQLRAEIAGSEWKKIAAFVRALNERGEKVDYTSFYKRVNGDAAMPMNVLLAALDTLGLDWMTFLSRAMERAAQESAD